MLVTLGLTNAEHGYLMRVLVPFIEDGNAIPAVKKALERTLKSKQEQTIFFGDMLTPLYLAAAAEQSIEKGMPRGEASAGRTLSLKLEQCYLAHRLRNTKPWQSLYP